METYKGCVIVEWSGDIQGCVIVEWSGDIQGMCNSGMEWRHTGDV